VVVNETIRQTHNWYCSAIHRHVGAFIRSSNIRRCRPRINSIVHYRCGVFRAIHIRHAARAPQLAAYYNCQRLLRLDADRLGRRAGVGGFVFRETERSPWSVIMKRLSIIVMLISISTVAESATSKPIPSGCTKQFIETWDRWNREGEIPTPDKPCIMRKDTGLYLCDSRGCGRESYLIPRR